MFNDLAKFEWKKYSQNGEDGVLARIFELIGTTNKYFIEFGVGPNGGQRNSRYLEEKYGWRGLLMDACAEDNHPRVQKEFITAENVNQLFAKYEVPNEFDLLSIDIDGNDYWVWKALDHRYQPRVVLIEYNAAFPPPASKTIAYDPDFQWNRTDYFGASLTALDRLGRRKGYVLIYCERRGINSFFVRRDLLPSDGQRPVKEIYRKPHYALGKFFGLAKFYWPHGVGHRPEKKRTMIDIEAETAGP